MTGTLGDGGLTSSRFLNLQTGYAVAYVFLEQLFQSNDLRFAMSSIIPAKCSKLFAYLHWKESQVLSSRLHLYQL